MSWIYFEYIYLKLLWDNVDMYFKLVGKYLFKGKSVYFSNEAMWTFWHLIHWSWAWWAKKICHMSHGAICPRESLLCFVSQVTWKRDFNTNKAAHVLFLFFCFFTVCGTLKEYTVRSNLIHSQQISTMDYNSVYNSVYNLYIQRSTSKDILPNSFTLDVYV